MRERRTTPNSRVRRRSRAGDRLASCGRAASLLVAGDGSYAYDALGWRVSTTTQEGTVRHVYDDSWQCLADIDEGGTVLRSYVWGEGIDNLLAVKIGGNVYYPLTDIQGTVWGYVDSQNNIVARWTYDAWGNVWLRVQLERKRLGMTVMALVKHLTISQRMGAVLMCVFLAHI